MNTSIKLPLDHVVTVPIQDNGRDVYFTGKVTSWGNALEGTVCMVRRTDGVMVKCNSWKVRSAKPMDRLLYA